jgi:hypothetical protein
MSNSYLTKDRVDSGASLEVFAKFIFWLLTTMVAIAVGLLVAWVSPHI